MNKQLNLSHTTNSENPDDASGIHEYYLNIISNMPNNVYWLDKNCITQGCNKNVLKFISPKEEPYLYFCSLERIQTQMHRHLLNKIQKFLQWLK